MAANATQWLLAQTPVIEGWKAEEDVFKSYCAQRDMGLPAHALARFFAPYWAGDFERRYADERRSCA